MRKLMMAGLLMSIITGPVVAEVTLPNTFETGTVASADQVNANFAALQEAIESLQEELAALKSRDVTGNSYTIYDFELGVERYGQADESATGDATELWLKQAVTVLEFHEGGTATWNLPVEENMEFDLEQHRVIERESLTEGPETLYWSQTGAELSIFEDAGMQQLAVVVIVSEGAHTFMTGQPKATVAEPTGQNTCFNNAAGMNDDPCYEDGLETYILMGVKN